MYTYIFYIFCPHWFALNEVQGKGPGEIQAKSQNGTQQDAKWRSVVEKWNGEKSETAKQAL